MNDKLPYRLSNKAVKQLKKIKLTDRTLYEKIKDEIDNIRKNPNIGQIKKGDLKGYLCLDIYHLKTNYELCYTIEKNQETGELILIILIGTRENFYKELKKYLNIK
jgi:mRNA-degrading endonuclease RelE of RelBE toxin-antitoxin system